MAAISRVWLRRFLISAVSVLGFLIAFFVLSFLFNPLVVKDEKTSSFKLVTRLKDRSVLLLSLFFLFTIYMGFTKIGALPKMYSDEFPQEYYELVNRAERGLEEPVDGVYGHEKFKELYDAFVNNNNNRKTHK